jgi:hypothetical protein
VEFFAENTLPVNGVEPLSAPAVEFDQVGDRLVR